jgi:hypothetical protein
VEVAVADAAAAGDRVVVAAVVAVVVAFRAEASAGADLAWAFPA